MDDATQAFLKATAEAGQEALYGDNDPLVIKEWVRKALAQVDTLPIPDHHRAQTREALRRLLSVQGLTGRSNTYATIQKAREPVERELHRMEG